MQVVYRDCSPVGLDLPCGILLERLPVDGEAVDGPGCAFACRACGAVGACVTLVAVATAAAVFFQRNPEGERVAREFEFVIVEVMVYGDGALRAAGYLEHRLVGVLYADLELIERLCIRAVRILATFVFGEVLRECVVVSCDGEVFGEFWVACFGKFEHSRSNELRFFVVLFSQVDNEFLGVILAERELRVARFGKGFPDAPHPYALRNVVCTQRSVGDDEEERAEYDGDVARLALDLVDEEDRDDDVEVDVDGDGVDAFCRDAVVADSADKADGHHGHERDARCGENLEEFFLERVAGSKARGVQDGDEREHVQHESRDEIRYHSLRHVPQQDELDDVGVKEEYGERKHRHEEEPDSARGELVQRGRFAVAFLDGRDAAEVEYGEDGTCAEVENIEIHLLIEFMFEKCAKTEDERFYGCEQECCDERGDS